MPENGIWKYKNNHSVLNFNTSRKSDFVDLNNYNFKPISKLQLLEFNTGESYPFSDRLIEYLTGSVITPIEEIPDNIKRVQHVMNKNNYYFKIDGLWENKIQNIIYDYVINSGPIESIIIGNDPKDPENFGKEVMPASDTNPTGYSLATKQILVDKHSGDSPERHGYHSRLGHSSKSTLYDVLGYVDKDAEKWYASWKISNNKSAVGTSLQSVDIYNKLYDI